MNRSELAAVFQFDDLRCVLANLSVLEWSAKLADTKAMLPRERKICDRARYEHSNELAIRGWYDHNGAVANYKAGARRRDQYLPI